MNINVHTHIRNLARTWVVGNIFPATATRTECGLQSLTEYASFTCSKSAGTDAFVLVSCVARDIAACLQWYPAMELPASIL